MVGDVAKSHPVIENPASPAKERPRTGSTKMGRGDGWAEWTPAKLRQRRGSIPPLLGRAEDDSDSDSGEDGRRSREGAHDLDRELDIMRRVFRKWCRLAGVSGKTCDDLTESECEVGWTKPIAPRVEGRIQMVSADST